MKETSVKTFDEDSVLSVRNTAEYAYCPRLFYMMEIEGLHMSNPDTEKGVSVHKNVDKPSHINPSNPSQTLRSLTLSSPSLGLTGVLDLVEIEGTRATPVEYRKGKPKNSYDSSSEGYSVWPTEEIQITLQAILLEEAGYTVEQGVVYYASTRTRVHVSITQELREQALRILEEARCVAQKGRPEPLLNDPKCVRCSLQPLCLPDEVHHQKNTSGVSMRSLWPPHSDGIQLVVQDKGASVGVRGMSLRVVNDAQNTVKEIPLKNVESVSLIGTVQISTQAIHVLTSHSIPVAFLSRAGRLMGMLDPIDAVSAYVRKSQARVCEDPLKSVQLCRALVHAKIMNQRTLLMRHQKEHAQEAIKGMLKSAQAVLEETSIDSIRGHEGKAAALYFEVFGNMVKGPLGALFTEHGRQRRPPPDPINTCLSFAYTMLSHECVSALRAARLEPTLGVLHMSKAARPALALDLMEPFRPLIADSIAITAFNKKELTEKDFIQTSSGCVFTDPGRQAFFQLYGKRMDTEITHPVFGYKMHYRRMIMLHARMLAAWFAGEIPHLSFLTTR
jgi:CRISPR-associated protein Cas1